MQAQLRYVKQDLKSDINKLLQKGVNIMDLFKRFGSIIFKSELLSAKDALERLT